VTDTEIGLLRHGACDTHGVIIEVEVVDKPADVDGRSRGSAQAARGADCAQKPPGSGLQAHDLASASAW
jgi:hypothetical protein